MYHRKDVSLDRLAQKGNVAQFVAYAPVSFGVEQTFCRVAGCEPNALFKEPREAVAALLAASAENSVNVRSYAPESPQSKEFVYGLRMIDDVLAVMDRLAGSGLHLIINETVNVADGGVSGVAHGSVLEFSPDDTPRCVEKPDVASLPRGLGMALLRTVYGFAPDLPDTHARVEFSIHPTKTGWKRSHTLLWELEEGAEPPVSAVLTWPNRFSRHIGDKVYGLILADLAGAHVPKTEAFCRRVAPFYFGSETGNHERWLRTCPKEQEPGLFTTVKGWIDPFDLLSREDPTGERIASVLSQSAVSAKYAGASIVDARGYTMVEGVAGEGDRFMLGQSSGQALPPLVVGDVKAAAAALQEIFGPVRTEWVHDGSRVWIVQMHRGATVSTSGTLVPGEPEEWRSFDVSDGLEALRSLIATLDKRCGLRLLGNIGMTSHVADLVRKAGLPARVESGTAEGNR